MNYAILTTNKNYKCPLKNAVIHYSERVQCPPFVKLRYDSLQKCKLKNCDWVMLGDDDMVFTDEFESFIENRIKPLTEKFDAVFCNETVFSPHIFDKAKITGIRTGFFIKYDSKIIEEFGSYRDFIGGGEDSLLALLYYYAGKKCVHVKNNTIIHSGTPNENYHNNLFEIIANGHFKPDIVFDMQAIGLFAENYNDIVK